jgi:hypothetical protein
VPTPQKTRRRVSVAEPIARQQKLCTLQKKSVAGRTVQILHDELGNGVRRLAENELIQNYSSPSATCNVST